MVWQNDYIVQTEELRMSHRPKMYLIDVENVGHRWLQLLQDLKDVDKILIFYTDVSMKFSFDNLKDMRPWMPQISLIRCFRGTPNALDFQLTGVLGQLSVRYPEFTYCIVSNDNGYDPWVLFLKGMGVSVYRHAFEEGQAVGDKIKVVHVTEPKKEEATTKVVAVKPATAEFSKAQVAKALQLPLNHKHVGEVVSILQKAQNYDSKSQKSSQKTYLNNTLQHLYSEMGHVYYRKLRVAGILKSLE